MTPTPIPDESEERRIIVNADDLGGGAETDAATFELMRSGRITSATMMANGPSLERVVAMAASLPTISYGVHLNASQFSPLAPTPGLRPILDLSGNFAGNRLREVRIDAALRKSLLVEWSAQVQRVLDLGVDVTHLDSHHHMHTLPGVFLVLRALRRRFGIPGVRVSMNIYSRAHPPASTGLPLKKALWNAALRHLGGARTTDGFTSLEVLHEAVRERVPPYRTIEVMVHPGNPLFVGETNLLMGQWEASLPFAVRLASYRDL